MNYTQNTVEKDICHPKIPIRAVTLFVSSFIEGIAQSVVINQPEGSQSELKPASDIAQMFQALAMAVDNFLEVS